MCNSMNKSQNVEYQELSLQKSFYAMTPLLQTAELNIVLFRDMYICGKNDFQTQEKKITQNSGQQLTGGEGGYY